MNAPAPLSARPPLLAAFVGAPAVNRVYNVTAEVMLAALPDASIDLVVTSPPYDSLRKYSGNWSFDFEYIAQQTYRVLKPGGVLVWVVGDGTVNGGETLTSMRQAIYFVDRVGFRMHDTMIWEKNTIPHGGDKKYKDDFEYMFVIVKETPNTFNPIAKMNATAGQTRHKTTSSANGSVHRPGMRVSPVTSILTNVWKITVGNSGTTKDAMAFDHPAIFPETLAERHILTWSNAGDVVLDYFGGSGTVAKMARKNGRRWLTNDISLEYCQLMEKRLAMPYTPSFMPALEAVG